MTAAVLFLYALFGAAVHAAFVARVSRDPVLGALAALAWPFATATWVLVAGVHALTRPGVPRRRIPGARARYVRSCNPIADVSGSQLRASDQAQDSAP